MPTAPTVELVRTACEQFDEENRHIEQALTELFHRYPENRDLRHVLLKAVTVNALYSTRIPVYSKSRPDITDVACHIQQMGQDVDSALATDSPEIVDKIASISVPGKKDRYYFSFATKYCSWHKPDSYPIWDSHVDRYVCSLKDQPRFAEFFNTGEDHWRYSEFRRLIIIFRDVHGLSSLGFKDMDKFLWKYGGE